MKTKLLPASSIQTEIYFSRIWIRLAFAFLFMIYLTGSASSQTKVWDKTLGGSRNDDLKAIVPTPDGGYLLGGAPISGETGDKTDFNRNGQILDEEKRKDYWVVKN